MRAWTAQDVERETLAGYSSAWPPFPPNPRLDAWNRAVSLGGEHYEAWRKANIEPIQRINVGTLWRHQITRIIEYEARYSYPTQKAPE